MNYLEVAKQAACQAGAFLKEHFGKPLDVDEAKHHDIKLALDRESQDLITRVLLGAFPATLSTARRVWPATRKATTTGLWIRSMAR